MVSNTTSSKKQKKRNSAKRRVQQETPLTTPQQRTVNNDSESTRNSERPSSEDAYQHAEPPERVHGWPSLRSYAFSLHRCTLPEHRTSGEDSARTRVHNTLFRVPYHLERFIWVGVVACLNTMLTFLTILPLRTLSDICQRRRWDSGVLFNIICCLSLFMGVYFHVAFLEPGTLYFGMKDVTAEFLKITLLYVALDVADKILSNVGVDIIEMLVESCQLFCEGKTCSMSLLLDVCLFLITTCAHSIVVMSIAMVWYVSMESEKTILAFMIISNFGEIKTTVFKRFDAKKLFILCRMDVVERVNLVIAALFIAVEDLGQIGEWTVNKDIVRNCALILVLETIVDITKHSVVVNFNGVRPGIYREYLTEVFRSVLQQEEEETMKKLVFEPFGPCILLLRVFHSALSIGTRHRRVRYMATGICFVALFTVKILMGWCLQVVAVWYLRYFDLNYGEEKKAFKTVKQA